MPSLTVTAPKPGVCVVTLDRPERLNALDDDIRTLLAAVVTELGDDPSARVLVIRGAGRSFSAGADLASGGAGPTDWSGRRHAAGAWQRLLDNLEALPVVTVARLHGHVIGGGAVLATSCDIRIASDDVSISLPEVLIGLPLTWAGIPRLVREVGLPMARDMVMTGRTVGAREAKECGLVQRVVPPDELDAATDALVDELLAVPPGTMATTRAAFSAMSRAATVGWSWADADILGWAVKEPEFLEAAGRALERRRSRRSAPEAPPD